MVATLPVTGKGNWTDFDDYWRDADASWLQDRVILRYTDNAERDGDLAAPGDGQVVYNNALGILQLRKSGAWRNYGSIPSNLVVTTDTTTSAGFAHVNAGGKGIVYSATEVHVTHDFNVNGGIFTVRTTTGVGIKTGSKQAYLTTSATHLVSDTPLSASAVALSGSGLVLDGSGAGKTAQLGATTVASLTSTGAVTASGAITAPSGTIGNVQFINNEVIVPTSQGMRSGQGWFYGDTASAIMRQTVDGVTGSVNYLQVNTGGINAAGNAGVFNIYPQMRIFHGKPIQWYDTGNTFRGNIAPVLYQATDPGATNYPDGTLWIS
jgi:hypothetical protein